MKKPEGNDMSILELRNIIKKYRMGDQIVTAVDNVTLNVSEGEFIAILGTSGCGKTTLMNISAGLERPTKGDVVFRSIVLSKLKEKKMVIFRRRYMGFVFQSYNLLPALTALENVAMPLLFDGVGKRERNTRAMRMLEMMGLADRYRHKPSELSGGQQQRVSIARALITKPHIVFADEPTGNLDSRTASEILNQLKDISKKENRTLIMVTHDQNVAGYADNQIRMSDGKLDVRD
jgi:putative ABC transport system ATP-binding protein